MCNIFITKHLSILGVFSSLFKHTPEKNHEQFAVKPIACHKE